MPQRTDGGFDAAVVDRENHTDPIQAKADTNGQEWTTLLPKQLAELAERVDYVLTIDPAHIHLYRTTGDDLGNPIVNLDTPRVLQTYDPDKGVAAVLGPTNTGKTHYAIERMLSHKSGTIGLPLRLLAREVFNRVVEKTGPQYVAQTGEEKIKPKGARYYVSTVEAMPRDLDLDFVAVDEIQLAADLDRGHVFTDRLLNQRGREETLRRRGHDPERR